MLSIPVRADRVRLVRHVVAAGDLQRDLQRVLPRAQQLGEEDSREVSLCTNRIVVD